MKCDRYGLGNKPSCMFGCKVILGQVKVCGRGLALLWAWFSYIQPDYTYTVYAMDIIVDL